MEEWKTYKLGELAEVKGGKRLPKGNMLTTLRNSHPYIRIRDLGATKTIELNSTYEYVEDDVQQLISKYIVKSGDVILSIVGTIGLTAIIGHSLNSANLTENCVKFTNLRGVDPNYLYYFLTSPLGQDEISKGIVGAVQPKLPIKNIQNISIPLPEIEAQRRIASILSSIDDKIELNRQINDNLEQQAEALYKSWFIDFEPFCEEKFIESSLGSIPTGWKVGQLSDVCEIVGGGTPSKNHPEYYCERGIAWLTPKDLSVSKSKFSSRGSEDITLEGYKNSSTKLMPRGTVLFSSRAPIGYISIATNEICTNQGFKSAVPGIAGTGYLYYFLKANTDKIESKASGSTFKEASGALMKSLEIIIPADGILNQFEAELAPILNKQENIASEIQALTTLRDTLLPKLMSGELKINEIDC